MNTPNPYIESVVKELKKHHPAWLDLFDMEEQKRILFFLRENLALAMEEGSSKGYEEGFLKGQKHAFGVDREAVRKEGEAAGRKAVIEEMKKVMSEWAGTGKAMIEDFEKCLQASQQI